MKNYSVNLNFIKIKNRGELGPDFGHVCSCRVMELIFMDEQLAFIYGGKTEWRCL